MLRYACLFLFFGLVTGAAQIRQGSELNKIYADESRCLTASEMQGQQDRSVSCFCRDALVDARYVYSTYLLTDKDTNLNGAYLGLLDHVKRQCGLSDAEVIDITRDQDWHWIGVKKSR